MHRRYLAALMLPAICLCADAWADQRYTVQQGDTLSAISERFYNDHQGWRLIYRANREQVFDGGNLVKTGTVLIIPDRPKGLEAATNKAWSSGADGRVSMARPTTLLLDGGQAFFGTIAGATTNSILIRRGVRTFRISLDQVKEVRLENRNGGVIAGELLNWSDGVFDLRANNFRLSVRNGEIINARVLSKGDINAPVEALPLATDVVIADTPVIRLDNGKQITGYVVDLKGTDLTVRRGARGSNRIKLADIAEVQIPTPDNGLVTGKLVDWADGIYRLQASNRTIVARESVVPSNPSPTVVTDLGTALSDEADADRQAVAVADAEPEPKTDPVRVRANDTTEVQRPEEGGHSDGKDAVSIQSVRTSAESRPELRSGRTDTAGAANRDDDGFGSELIPIEQIVPGDDEVIFVKARALAASEKDDVLRFEINLSRAPEERKLVIVYASVSGTATSGRDYERSTGVLDIEPGITSAIIDLPLLDDDQVEPDESVHLFISPDPSRAKVETRDIVGLIEDDDG